MLVLKPVTSSFKGNVVVHGNVLNGFKIEAEGDVVIIGNVEAAEITAGGKISVKGRVFGNDRGKLYCKGEFYAREIERVTLICDDSVTIHDAILHSNVSAEKKVTVETGKGWIVGGLVRAGEEIAARIIGSKMGTITEVMVGPIFKPKIVDLPPTQESSSVEDAKTSTTEQAAIESTNTPSIPTSAPADESETGKKPPGRIRFKDFMYPGVRAGFEAYKFVIQDQLNYGSVTCSDGYLHLLPYR